MSSSTIFDAFRTLLTGLSLVDDPDGTPLENEAISRFTSEASLDVEEARSGPFIGGRIQSVRPTMVARRGITVTSDRDTANKAYLSAVDAIIQSFLDPTNRPSGCRQVSFISYSKEEQSADVWIVSVFFEIEYKLAV